MADDFAAIAAIRRRWPLYLAQRGASDTRGENGHLALLRFRLLEQWVDRSTSFMTRTVKLCRSIWSVQIDHGYPTARWPPRLPPFQQVFYAVACMLPWGAPMRERPTERQVNGLSIGRGPSVEIWTTSRSPAASARGHRSRVDLLRQSSWRMSTSRTAYGGFAYQYERRNKARSLVDSSHQVMHKHRTVSAAHRPSAGTASPRRFTFRSISGCWHVPAFLIASRDRSPKRTAAGEIVSRSMPVIELAQMLSLPQLIDYHEVFVVHERLLVFDPRRRPGAAQILVLLSHDDVD